MRLQRRPTDGTMTSVAGSCASALVLDRSRSEVSPAGSGGAPVLRDKPEIRLRFAPVARSFAPATLVRFGGHASPRRWGIHEGDSDIHCGRLRGGVRDRRMGAGARAASAAARQSRSRTPRHRRSGYRSVRQVLRSHLQDEAAPAAGARHRALLRAARRSAAGPTDRLHRDRRRDRGGPHRSDTTACWRRRTTATRSPARWTPPACRRKRRRPGQLACGRMPMVSSCSCSSRLQVSSPRPSTRRCRSTATGSSRRLASIT